jgi:hypothetical protein
MAIKMGTPKPKNLSISNATYSGKSFVTTTQETTPISVAFNDTGSKMYILGNTANAVFEYTLSTNFDVSTATYTSNSISTGVNWNAGLTFNSTGTKLFFTATSSVDEIRTITLTSAYDISTASVTGGTLDVQPQTQNPLGMHFNPSGTKMMLCDNNGDNILQYSLSTGFDITTATYDSVLLDVSAQDTGVFSVYLNSTGTRMFLCGYSTSTVYQYSLSTGFDLSTAVYDNISVDISSLTSDLTDVEFNSSGTKMFVIARDIDSVLEYNL